jgi:hypothetical protein
MSRLAKMKIKIKAFLIECICEGNLRCNVAPIHTIMLVFDISAGGYAYCFLYSEKINPCHMSLGENFDGLNAIDRKAAVRRARMIALILSGAWFIIIISFVYARIQKAQADEYRTEAEQVKVEMEEVKAQLRKQTQIATLNEAMALASKEEADRQRALAVNLESQLLKCRMSK